jgi:hypothetical protein
VRIDGIKEIRTRAGGALLMLALLAGGCGAPASTTAPVAPTTPESSASTAGVTASPEASSAAPASASAVASSPSAASSPPPTGADWPVYHRDAARTGLDPAFPAPNAPAVAWTATLDGAVYGQPLVIGGRIIAATEGDSVYALDPADGRVLWVRNVGTPVSRSTLPCGNIDPLGITSTAAYDAASDTVFVVAEMAGPKHVLVALDPAAGTVRWTRQVDLDGDDPTTHQQRAALAVANGHVYIGFGGLAGDCGQYTGKVVGVPVTGEGATIAYRVPVQREGAVWATGGPVVDPAGNLFVSTGNGSSTTTWDGSDSVVKLSPDLAPLSRFAPSSWAQDNAQDADLGSLSPVLVPGGWVFIAGKSGTGYVLRQDDLGGIGGQVSAGDVCRAFGGSAQDGATIYVPCTDGIRAVTVGADGTFRVGWHTDAGADGPPVAGGGAVWSVATSPGTLFALDAAIGTEVGRVGLGAVPHFASPTLWGGLVLVGTMSGVVAVRAAP